VIRRHGYTEPYRRTIAYVRDELEALGFAVGADPIGTLVARNRPAGEPVFGLGSHCDSNRNGGRYDGTLGVVAALEVCRLDRELGLGLPLQVMSFFEEEGSGFGFGLLGSRVMTGRVNDAELCELRSVDDGRSLTEHAEAAGFAPARWRESARALDTLTGWIELHIEQGRVLQDGGLRVGIVDAITGFVQADLTVRGRADHAGSTPMDQRLDPGPVAGACLLELERLAREAPAPAVATVGEIEARPGQITAIPESVRLALDIRSVDAGTFRGVARDIVRFAEREARARGLTADYRERQAVEPTTLAPEVVAALRAAAARIGEPSTTLPSHALHDTALLAEHVPSAMVFVPCRDGISHSPLESASPADATVGVEIMLHAVVALTANIGRSADAPRRIPADHRGEAQQT
jgi:hydantoinase/carbamoylase family amidase